MRAAMSAWYVDATLASEETRQLLRARRTRGVRFDEHDRDAADTISACDP